MVGKFQWGKLGYFSHYMRAEVLLQGQRLCIPQNLFLWHASNLIPDWCNASGTDARPTPEALPIFVDCFRNWQNWHARSPEWILFLFEDMAAVVPKNETPNKPAPEERAPNHLPQPKGCGVLVPIYIYILLYNNPYTCAWVSVDSFWPTFVIT